MKRTIDLTLEQYDELCKKNPLDLTLAEEYKMCWFEVLNKINGNTEAGKVILDGYMKRIENLEKMLIKGKSKVVPKWRYVELKKTKIEAEKDCVCEKCGGSGRIPAYSHIDSGICFKCKGTGKKYVSK